jgi:hypothetical protein
MPQATLVDALALHATRKPTGNGLIATAGLIGRFADPAAQQISPPERMRHSPRAHPVLLACHLLAACAIDRSRSIMSHTGMSFERNAEIAVG